LGTFNIEKGTATGDLEGLPREPEVTAAASDIHMRAQKTEKYMKPKKESYSVVIALLSLSSHILVCLSKCGGPQ